jgi:hypothetical protein
MAQSSFQQNKNVKLLFWAGPTFLGLNMKHKENFLYRHALTKKKIPLAYLSNINDATFPTLSIYHEI